MKTLNNLLIIPLFFVAIFISVSAKCQNSSVVDIEFFYNSDDISFLDVTKLSTFAVKDLKRILNREYKISIPPKSIEEPISTFQDKLNIKYKGKAHTFIFGYIEVYNENSYNIDLHVYTQTGVQKDDGTIDIELIDQHFGSQNIYIKNWLDSGIREPEMEKLVKKLAPTFKQIFPPTNPTKPKIAWKELGTIGGGVILSGTGAFLRFKGNEKYQVYLDDSQQVGLTDDLRTARNRNRWAHTTAVIGIAVIATGAYFLLNKDDEVSVRHRQNPENRFTLSPHIEPYPFLNANGIGGKITYSF